MRYTTFIFLLFGYSLFAQSELPEIFFPKGKCSGKECFDYWMNDQKELFKTCMAELKKDCNENGESKTKNKDVIKPPQPPTPLITTPPPSPLILKEIMSKTIGENRVYGSPICNSFDFRIQDDPSGLTVYKIKPNDNCTDAEKKAWITTVTGVTGANSKSYISSFISVLLDNKEISNSCAQYPISNRVDSWKNQGDTYFKSSNDIDENIRLSSSEKNFSFLIPAESGVFLVNNSGSHKISQIEINWFRIQPKDSYDSIISRQKILDQLAIIASVDEDFRIQKENIFSTTPSLIIEATINKQKTLLGIYEYGIHYFVDVVNDEQLLLSKSYSKNSQSFPIKNIIDKFVLSGGSEKATLLSFIPSSQLTGLSNLTSDLAGYEKNILQSIKNRSNLKGKFLIKQGSKLIVTDAVDTAFVKGLRRIGNIENQSVMHLAIINKDLLVVPKGKIVALISNNFKSIYIMSQEKNNIRAVDFICCASTSGSEKQKKEDINNYMQDFLELENEYQKPNNPNRIDPISNFQRQFEDALINSQKVLLK